MFTKVQSMIKIYTKQFNTLITKVMIRLGFSFRCLVIEGEYFIKFFDLCVLLSVHFHVFAVSAWLCNAN